VGRLQVEYGRRVILIERDLTARARRCVLGHELIHDERDLLYDTDTPAEVVAKEERAVEVELARRLVPPFELMGFVRRRATVGPVTVAQVADEFDVTEEVALLAMRIVEDGLAA
jgi:Zn-dependent peptidase ImmA (M78 family)